MELLPLYAAVFSTVSQASTARFYTVRWGGELDY